MGLFRADTNAGQILPLTPLTSFDADSNFSLSSPSSPQSIASPIGSINSLTLPTVLHESRGSVSPQQGDAFDLVQNARSMSLLDPYGQSKLFLPVFPKPFLGLGVNGLRWLSENPLRQRGLRFRPEEDPNSFVTCQLCGNSILGNREINLQNHARRHSKLKQFQCCYCHYTHSEITKVRLHMAHNHNDNHSRPINNVNGEMRESWRALMNDCFPGHPFVNDQIQKKITQQAAVAVAALQYQRLANSQLRFCPY